MLSFVGCIRTDAVIDDFLSHSLVMSEVGKGQEVAKVEGNCYW